jgi:pentatricopeptide repeat protein
MKSAWFIISTLAVANLLAIAAFIGWLGATHRLTRERIDSVRQVFTRTIVDEERDRIAAEAENPSAPAAPPASAKPAFAPVSSAERLASQQVGEKIELQHLLRRESEINALRVFLQKENDRLQKWQTDLKAQEAAFKAERKKIIDMDGSEQFKKALATIEAIKPKDAQSMMAALIKNGKTDEVVAYLNAMEERGRGKVMTEFNKADPKLAADLLERLRTRGLLAAGTEEGRK